jgi:hypothetical protein
MRMWEHETQSTQHRTLSSASHARRAGTREHSSRYHEDGDKYVTEDSWFLPYGSPDVREEVKQDGASCILGGLYTYNGLLNGDITYEAILISDMS